VVLRALSLDLFGTIVFFDDQRLPRRVYEGREYVVTIPALEDLLVRARLDIAPLEFLRAVVAASEEIGREKASTLREIPTAARYSRALRRLGAPNDAVDSVATTMAESHMQTLSSAIVCPQDRVELLRELAARYPLALLSNFDHAPTARAILDRFRLASAFRIVAISAEVGFVKPAAEIFQFVCRALEVEPEECLHVGDSQEADVRGAIAAGLGCVRVGERRGDQTIGDLRELPAWLRARHG
jgi:HAD superfamily hydrolase (TIGR01549 family)